MNFLRANKLKFFQQSDFRKIIAGVFYLFLIYNLIALIDTFKNISCAYLFLTRFSLASPF